MLPSVLWVMTTHRKSERLEVQSHPLASTFSFEIADSQAARTHALLFPAWLLVKYSVIILGTFAFIFVDKKQVLGAWPSK